jgi:hypothetical protein
MFAGKLKTQFIMKILFQISLFILAFQFLNFEIIAQTEDVLRLKIINPGIALEKSLGKTTTLDLRFMDCTISSFWNCKKISKFFWLRGKQATHLRLGIRFIRLLEACFPSEPKTCIRACYR